MVSMISLATGQSCDPFEWHAWGNSSYHLFGGSSDSEDPLPFREARQFCNDQKGDLAQLKTQETKVIHSFRCVLNWIPRVRV